MTNIISLTGEPVKDPGTPDEAIIAILEQLLERAKSGNIVSLVAAGTLRNGEKNFFAISASSLDRYYTTIGVVDELKAMIRAAARRISS